MLERRYKIGELEKIFGIPAQTIRFYESKGLISPIKDPETGYRYYDNWTINFILDVIQLRQYDFSLNEIHDIFCANELEEVTKIIDSKEYELLKKISELQIIVELLDKKKHKIKQLDTPEFELVESPQLLFHEYRSREALNVGPGMDVETVKWMNMIPKAEASFIIDDIEVNQKTNYRWGYAMDTRDAIEKGMDFSKNRILFSKKAIHTTFEAKSEDTFIRSFMEQVVAKILKMGYRITDKPYGKLIIRTNALDELRRFFEVYVPVEE